MTTDYATFLETKAQAGAAHGFTPTFLPDSLFDFQRALVEWAVRQGRAALYADTGLGKSVMALAWAENVVRHTNRPVLLLTPLAVGPQFVREGEKFGIACERSRDGTHSTEARIVVTNYQQLAKFSPGGFAGVVCDESAILKHADAETRHDVTEFLRTVPYRLLATATAAPNDWTELGTSSEALGYFGHVDMLGRFFVIERALVLWSNPGEAVLTPFMGVGSEVYGAVRAGRKGIGVELKASYYHQAVKNCAAAKAEREAQEPMLFAAPAEAEA